MTLTKNLLIFLFLSLAYENTFAQKTPTDSLKKTKNTENLLATNTTIGTNYYDNLVAPSPTAASLGSYGETPVSLYTGTPNIGIPLYTLKGVELSVPVSLSYNASGIRVEENASWVGLGWSLNAGGVITQSIRGKQDFTGYQNISDNLPLLTSTLAERQATFATLQNIPSGAYDFEADIFNFNFMGMSGSFVFDKDGKAWFSNFENYKVVSGNGGFTITKDNGNIYEFNSTEITNSTVTSFYLTKITSASGKEVVNFMYAEELFGYYQSVKYSKAITPNGGGFLLNYEDSKRSNLALIVGKRLTSISFTDLGTIEFTPQSSPRIDLGSLGNNKTCYALAMIQVKNVNNEIVKKYKLEYDFIQSNDTYFGPDSFCPLCPATGIATEHLNYRMYLKKVTEQAPNSASNINPYEFEYYGRLANGKDELPYKISASQDHWGFFNNASNGLNLWPGFCGPFGAVDPYYNLSISCVTSGVDALLNWNQSSANRSTNTSSIIAGTLKRITYPTKGYTDYFYESNSFNSIGNPGFYNEFKDCNGIAITVGGGIRVKEIKSFEGFTQLKGTEFLYEFGNLRAKPHYYNYYTILPCNGARSYVYQDCSTVCGNDVDKHIWVEINCGVLNDVGYRGGPIVGYEKVTQKEYLYNNLSQKQYNGAVVQTFRTENNDPTSAEFYENKMGYIYSDDAGATNNYVVNTVNLTSDYVFPFTPIRNTDWRHGQLLTKTISAQNNNLVAEQINIYTNSSVTEIPSAKVYQLRQDRDFLFLNYGFISGWPKLVSQTDRNYDMNGQNPVETVKTIEYHSGLHKYPTLESSTNSKGQLLSTEYRYPPDFPSNSTYTEMVNRNMIAPIIEQTEKIDGTQTSAQFNEYAVFNPGNFILPSKLKTQLASSDPIIEQVNYTEYDNRANPTQYILSDGKTTKLQWYNTSDNGKTDLLKAQIIGGGINAVDLPQTTNYDYYPLVGLKSSTDINGKTTNYEYDAFNRLQYIKDENNLIIASFCYNYAGQSVACGTVNNTGKIEGSALALIDKLSGPLPLNLLNFSVKNIEDNANLSWETTEEVGTKSFDIEHSLDAKSWQYLSTIDAKGGGKAKTNYSYLHLTPPACDNYYRLKMNDADGKFEYSKIVLLKIVDIGFVYPNPISKNEKLYLDKANLLEIKQLELIDATGRKILNTSNIQKSIDLNAVPIGKYALKLTYKNGTAHVFNLIKQ